MRRFAPAAILLLLATAGFGQITSERPVSTPVYAPVDAFSSASIASNGDGFLAVWGDGRANWAVYASRIDRYGTVLDPLGIYVAAYDGSYASVAWNGDAYLVAWSNPNGIAAARIAPDGRIVNPPHLILQGNMLLAFAANANVSVFRTNEGYAVFDRDMRLTGSGTLCCYQSPQKTGPDEFTIFATAGLGSPNVTYPTLRLDSFGHPVSSATLPARIDGTISCHRQDCIRVAFNEATKRLDVMRYDPIAMKSGTPFDMGIPWAPLNLLATDWGYLLVLSSNKTYRLDMQGNPSSAVSSKCCPNTESFSVASNGRDAVMLRRSYSSLTATLITPTTEGEPHDVAISATSQEYPAIARGASNYLAAWTEHDGIYAGRLSFDGTILDGRGHLIRSRKGDPTPYDGPLQWSSSVAFDGTSYIVAASAAFDPNIYDPNGTAGRSITVARVDPATGATLASSTICGNEMRIARNGSATLAVWIDCAGSVVAAYLDVNGAPASLPVTLARSATAAFGSPSPGKPSLAWNGTEWLVTWHLQYLYQLDTPFSGTAIETYGVAGMRLSGALTPLDRKPIPITTGWMTYPSSRVASDGHDFLAVWGEGTAIHARRISASGEALAEQTAGVGALVGDLVWDGAAYSLAYVTATGNLSLVRLRDQVGQPLTIDAVSATGAALTTAGDGGVIVAYTRIAREPLYAGVSRVFVSAPHPFTGGRLPGRRAP
ncbi:MAG: hypothetical protein QOC81_1027 [Thermoanaerobaculia bacterium]|nr:hypothetical protein [Thermoanaerobaculia bacterium]